MVRRVVLASSAPQGAAGMHGWAPAVIDAVGKPDVGADEYLEVFFTSAPSSRKAGPGNRAAPGSTRMGFQSRKLFLIITREMFHN